MNLSACLRFLRKHQEISAIQMFLMWRHVPYGTAMQGMEPIAQRIYDGLPMAPESNALFSNPEIEAILRLTHEVRLPHCANGWALANRCVWERIAPSDFSTSCAAPLLEAAHEADDITTFAIQAMHKDSPYYAAVFDLLAAPSVRATRPCHVDDQEFRTYLSELKGAGSPQNKGAKPS